MKKRRFFQNAAIMTVTSIVLRSIGIVFRVYISNRVGAEGMGLYQLIISVYVLASSFASAGLCTAVTRLCTDEIAREKTRSVKKIVTISIWLSIIIGIISAVVIILAADLIAVTFLNDYRAIPSLKIMTFSLPFMGVSSCIRGYFMARRRVTSSSLSQILEQIVRIGMIVGIFETTTSVGVEKACFAILLGDTVAEGVSCLYMAICYWIDRRRIQHTNSEPSSTTSILRDSVHIALPITAGRYLNSVLRTIENIMVPSSLDQYTNSHSISLSQFGKLKGMAMPLIFFPSSFLSAFAMLLIPEISQARAQSAHRQLHYTISRTFQMTLLSSILISGLFWVLAYPLSDLVYNDIEVGQMIRVLAPLAPIMYLESVIVGILKGLDQQSHSLLYSVVDSVSRIVFIILVIPRYGINGFMGIMVFSNILTCALNTGRLCQVTHFRMRYRQWIIRPCIIMISATWIGTHIPCDGQDPIAQCILRGGVVILIYCILLPLCRCVTREDFITFKPVKKRTL